MNQVIDLEAATERHGKCITFPQMHRRKLTTVKLEQLQQNYAGLFESRGPLGLASSPLTGAATASRAGLIAPIVR
jgi:hypothetical protein